MVDPNINYFTQFKTITDEIHAYRCEGLHDKMLEYKDEFINIFEQEYEGYWAQAQYNVPYVNMEMYPYVNGLFHHIVQKYYLVDETWTEPKISVYLQTNKRARNVFHNHSPQSLVCTTYVNPCDPSGKEGGGLEFLNPPHDNLTIYPEKDVVYFFPGWMYHRPLEQTREEPRICLNWGYVCTKRPIHKLCGQRM